MTTNSKKLLALGIYNERKTFSFSAPNKKPERQVDSIKYEIKKYIGRERRKKLPENVDFWDFDCKIGANAEEAKYVHVAEINKAISKLLTRN